MKNNLTTPPHTRKIAGRVCRCTPDGTVSYLEARLLKELVDREIHPIRCASTCSRKALKGLYIGNLCAEAHHPLWALKVWKFTLAQIHWKDYADWINVWFNTEYVRLRDVISDGICEIIGRRIDDVERAVGLADAHGRDSWEYLAGDGWYDSLFYEKYDSDWESMRDSLIETRRETMERQHSERFFYEVQGELPPMAQNFFDYWSDYVPIPAEELYFKIDDRD